jgi:protein-(glutamine-N5) methyltransferase, release factor-specific
MVLDVGFGLSLADVYADKVTQLSQDDARLLHKMMDKLVQGVPVQYVLGRAEFAGRTFEVGQGVLIPRPETEELCAWIVQVCKDRATTGTPPTLLDIGTGSGCIATTLALDLPTWRVSAIDISQKALEIATRNAQKLDAEVQFALQDALCMPPDTNLWDVIVSNPPYIMQCEARQMHPNVLQNEPHSALFVPNEEPLLFYESIARYALHALKSGGKLFFEINPLCHEVMQKMLANMGWQAIETRNDAFGKQRMMSATCPNK